MKLTTPVCRRIIARWLVAAVFGLAGLQTTVRALQGTVSTSVTTTNSSGATIRFSLYLPPGHVAGGAQRFPVVYHLHGINGTHSGNQVSSVPASHEAAVAAGLIEPAIIVFPDGYDDSFWADSATTAKPAESDVLAIIRHVDTNYATRASRLSRAIQGFSMGGFGAAKFATKHPDLFCVAVIYDGALLDWAETQQRHASVVAEFFKNSAAYYDQFSPWYWTPVNAEALRSGVPFRQVVGALQDNNREFRDLLAKHGITSSYVETTAPHSLQPLLDQGGADSWKFIAVAFGASGPVPVPPGSSPGVVVPAAVPKTFAASSGLYGLLTTNVSAGSSQVSAFLTHADFAGVSVRTYWRDIETSEDNYDWSYYDAMIATAQAAGKKVILRLEAAWASPAWVFTKVSASGGPLYEYFEKHQETSPDVKERMPAPWDATYLYHWKNFVAAFGARYNGNAAVAGVLISGCSRSTEMYLPVFPTDGGPDWNAAPFSYTPQKLTTAWTGVIDAFAAAFPNKPIGLSLSTTLADDGVVEAVTAHGVTEYPWHFFVKISYWNNANSVTFHPTAALLAVADEYTHGGLEPAGAAQTDINATAINAAISWHTLGIFEVYQAQRNNFATLKTAIDTRRDMIEKMTFSGTAQAGQTALTWAIGSPNPYPTGFKVMRKTGDFPAGIGDAVATTVYDGNNSGGATDSGLNNGTTYYYSVFEKSNGYTLAQVTLVPVAVAGAPTPTPTPTPPIPTPTPTPPANGNSGGGGGGAVSWWALTLLVSAGVLKFRSKLKASRGV